MGSAVRRTKCAAAACAARPGRPQALLAPGRVSARNPSRRKMLVSVGQENPNQLHRVNDLAAAGRCAHRSLSSGAFSVVAFLVGSWCRELVPRGTSVGGWDRFLIRKTFNGSTALGPGLK